MQKLKSKSSSSLNVWCVLSTGRPGCPAVHRLRPEGADQTLSLLRGFREPPLLPGNHIQRSGKTTLSDTFVVVVLSHLRACDQLPLRCSSVECAS